jgi:hypothetical protein
MHAASAGRQIAASAGRQIADLLLVGVLTVRVPRPVRRTDSNHENLKARLCRSYRPDFVRINIHLLYVSFRDR